MEKNEEKTITSIRDIYTYNPEISKKKRKLGRIPKSDLNKKRLRNSLIINLQ